MFGLRSFSTFPAIALRQAPALTGRGQVLKCFKNVKNTTRKGVAFFGTLSGTTSRQSRYIEPVALVRHGGGMLLQADKYELKNPAKAIGHSSFTYHNKA